MNNSGGFDIAHALNSVTPTQILGVLLVAIFLFKKLIKWAVILGVLFIVVLPYVENSAAFDTLKTKLGL